MSYAATASVLSGHGHLVSGSSVLSLLVRFCRGIFDEEAMI